MLINCQFDAAKVRHNLASLHYDEVCNDVEIEPKLQLLEGASFHKKTTTSLLKMTLDLTSRQMDSGEADSAEPFPMQKFATPMLNPALKLYLTPTNIMSVSKH